MTTNSQKNVKVDEYTWMEHPDDHIVLVNTTSQNFILDLPSGRYRLDAGRRMHTLRSILKQEPILDLLNEGKLVIE